MGSKHLALAIDLNICFNCPSPSHYQKFNKFSYYYMQQSDQHLQLSNFQVKSSNYQSIYRFTI